jgi:hypothetical protein
MLWIVTETGDLIGLIVNAILVILIVVVFMFHHALLCRCHAMLCWSILITPYPATALRDPGHALQGPHHYRNRRRLTSARTKSRKRLHADEGECIQHCAAAGAA